MRPAALDVRLLDARPEGASPLGWRCFQLGLFLLASSAFLGGLLLFVALIQGSRHRSSPWGELTNRWLLLAAALMVLGCFTARSGGLAWVGLANWLPFFWAFWGYQPYLATPEARRRVALWLVAGTVPVVATGLGQLFLGWSGPFQALGGLVIWHLEAGGSPEGRLSGLFDYANIAGAWLVLAWPLQLAALLEGLQQWRQGLRDAAGSASVEPRGLLLRLGVLLALAIGVVAAVFLTDSRNAWGALVLAVPLVLGPASWLWLLPLLLGLLLLVTLASLPGVPPLLQEPLRQLVPEAIWGRLSDLHHGADRVQASTRLAQWQVALELIAERPWLGWGAAAFSLLYPLRTGQWHGHPHNLPIDLAVSQGVPVALLVVGVVLSLLWRSFRAGMAAAGPFDRAWWAAALVLAALHATDIPFYDSRINVAGWVLLAGLACGARKRQGENGAVGVEPRRAPRGGF
ncbi:MAG: O-antigen ligase family protein [Synechococcus sp.]